MQNNIQSLFTEIVPGSAEYKVRTTTGERRWILVRSQPIKEGDHVTGLQGVLTDITVRKEMEAHLKEAAAVAERNRLARDLHDSVTQVLFAASLVAEVLPQIWSRDRTMAMESLEEIRRLTRGALAEMRTMLLELRPYSLLKTPLPELLAQLTEATTGRTGLLFQLSIEQIPSLPDVVHISFYSIAQESLNNAVKHARASQVKVSLTTKPLAPDSAGETKQDVKLTIEDDGVGYTPGVGRPEQMGLGIMNERAQAIGANLSIDSQPGIGTRVTLKWTGKLEKENESN